MTEHSVEEEFRSWLRDAIVRLDAKLETKSNGLAASVAAVQNEVTQVVTRVAALEKAAERRWQTGLSVWVALIALGGSIFSTVIALLHH